MQAFIRPFALIAFFTLHASADDLSALQKNAEAGQAEAQYQWGKACMSGKQTAKDLPQARRWLQAAADQGHAQAKEWTGIMLAEGMGGTRDEAAAVRYLREAAEAGVATAQFNYATLLNKGRGIARNANEALVWFEKAAAQGNLPAHKHLADQYYFGVDGQAADYAKALPHVKAAAELGDAWAQNLYGSMGEFGQAMKTDRKLAMLWYEKAARQGEVKAQANLGRMLRSGDAGEQDPVAAYAWLKLAAEHGDRTAQFSLDDLKLAFTPEQSMQGEQRLLELQRSVPRQWPKSALPLARPFRPAEDRRD